MKRIVILCDGTWNKSDAPHPTNVMQLATAVNRTDTRTDTNGIVQQVIYVAGVGSGKGTSWYARTKDRITGGVLGWGLEDNIEEAYWHLAFNYQTGDEIYIFGFSRGAFTARSLAGLIRSCGIPPEKNIHRIPEAMASYASRGPDNHPDAPGSLDFRASFSPLVATSQREVEARKRDGKGANYLLRITYLGVWDTVGALGIPNQLMISRWVNRKYEFHDHTLSSSIRSARHAVAVDERRKNFLPTLWKNIDEMNDDKTDSDAKYQQLWFPGDHGSVGGGGDILKLSGRTLEWVIEGARRQGLSINDAEIGPTIKSADPMGPLVNSSKPLGIGARVLRMLSTDREGPRHRGNLSDFAEKRMKADSSYRPKTLDKFWPN